MRIPPAFFACKARVNRPRIAVGVMFALALCMTPRHAGATTVIAPDFDSLVQQADYVVRAVVNSKTSEWRSDAYGRHIFTKVKLDVLEILKGSPPSPLVLEMLGGRIGTQEMVVDGAPSFLVGEEDILFIHGNGRQFNPLVSLMYGMYPVSADTASGQRFVHRSNGSPLYNAKDIALPMTAANALGQGAARPLTSAEFSIKIRLSVAQRPIQSQPNAN
jgi:hypothetical protein